MLRTSKAECKELKIQNQKQTENLKNLASYVKQLSEIKNKKEETENKIQKAVNDEEIDNIISTLIEYNNNRVQVSTDD
jgi:protein subunit release factor B